MCAGSSGKGPGHGGAREGGQVDGEGVRGPGGGSGPGACNHAQQAHRVTGGSSGRHEAQQWLGPDGGRVCWAEEGQGDLLGGQAGRSGDERGLRRGGGGGVHSAARTGLRGAPQGQSLDHPPNLGALVGCQSRRRTSQEGAARAAGNERP